MSNAPPCIGKPLYSFYEETLLNFACPSFVAERRKREVFNFILRRIREFSKIQLLCTEGIHKDQKFSLKSRDQIGRDRKCAIVLDDAMIARIHCVILYTAGIWRIVCMGINGMVIDGVMHLPNPSGIPLKKGMSIRIGTSVFKVL